MGLCMHFDLVNPWCVVPIHVAPIAVIHRRVRGRRLHRPHHRCPPAHPHLLVAPERGACWLWGRVRLVAAPLAPPPSRRRALGRRLPCLHLVAMPSAPPRIVSISSPRPRRRLASSPPRRRASAPPSFPSTSSPRLGAASHSPPPRRRASAPPPIASALSPRLGAASLRLRLVAAPWRRLSSPPSRRHASAPPPTASASTPLPGDASFASVSSPRLSAPPTLSTFSTFSPRVRVLYVQFNSIRLRLDAAPSAPPPLPPSRRHALGAASHCLHLVATPRRRLPLPPPRCRSSAPPPFASVSSPRHSLVYFFE